MFSLSFFKSRSIFISWLKSYLLVLLVLILINGAVYIQTQKVNQKEINRTNEVMLRQMQQSLDIGLNDIATLMFQVSMNSNLRRMFPWTRDYVNNIQFTPEYYPVVETIKELTKYKSVNGFVVEMYIYLKNSDMILSPTGFLDAATFYQAIRENTYYHEGMDYDTWYGNLKGIHSKTWILDKVGTNVNYGNSFFVKMLQSIPLNTESGSDATLVFLLNRERFMNSIDNISAMYNGWTLILDSKNQALFSNIPGDRAWKPEYSELPGKTGLKYEVINGEKHVISYIGSEGSDWKYISVLPFNLYQEKVKYAWNLMLAGVLISLAIGMLLAYYFSRRNYYPVNELVHIISRRFAGFKLTRQNEYRLIKDAVNSAMDENEKIRKSLRQQDTVLRANFLNKLLKGKLENDDFIKSAFNNYNMNLYSESFAVMIFYITDFSRLFKGTEKTYEEKMEFVQFIMANVIEELASQNNVGFMVQVDEMPVCLLNYREGNITSAKHEVTRIIQEARLFISQKFNIDFLVSVSNVHKTVFGIPAAFKEAMDVMEYETVMDDTNVLFYEDMKNPEYDYNFSMENEYQLINCIKSGESEAAQKILGNIFDNTLNNGRLSIDIARCLMYDLASTILKALNELDPEQKSILLKNMDFPGKLQSSEKVLEMKQYMYRILEEVCTGIRQYRSPRRYERIEDVIRHIEENYTDVNFCVTSVSDKFQLTPSYLARMFKEHTGKGILEYINNCRIEKAKQLLRENNCSIKDIAARVGYYNINAFNRMFKKNEGITPGSYKESNMQSGTDY